MTPVFPAALALAVLVCCQADPVPKTDIRWCTISDPEFKKCLAFKDAVKDCKLSCVSRTNTHACIKSISEYEADAICLDGGHVYDAGLAPYNLKPIMVEDYGNEKETDTCYYAVAVAKKGTDIKFTELKGKKSCHTGLDKTAGWNIPMGTLIDQKQITWTGSDDEPLQRTVSKFFLESCVPGAKEPNLCSLCKGKGEYKCSRSDNEPYYNYDGALRCLEQGGGEVAFVKHTTVPAEKADMFELLCPDGTRKAISEYKDCNLGRVPAHAVVTQSSGEKTEAIRQCLAKAQAEFGMEGKSFHLFSSPDGRKDLLFKNSAKRIIPLPDSMDSFLFLGTRYCGAIQGLRKTSSIVPSKSNKVYWCTLSKAEEAQCDAWSAVSGDAIGCKSGTSVDDCIKKIQRREADAIALDGGYMYTAGKCGLVPAMGEYYDTGDKSPCNTKGSTVKGTYYAVAVVKKIDPTINWNNLKNKKACHTGKDRTAGWNIPMGHLSKDCKFDVFSESCAPGADPSSKLCALCVGNPGLKGEESKCQASSKELYYGYSGALRCLVEAGDVGFMKHTTIFENTDGANTASWAKDLKSSEFELLCMDGTRAPPSKYQECNLGQVPAHAVMTRPEKQTQVVRVLLNQQSLFGRDGEEKDMFQMFGPHKEGKDLIFKDSTQCLIEVPAKTSTETFLGADYHSAIAGLKNCSPGSDLISACTFHSCS